MALVSDCWTPFIKSVGVFTAALAVVCLPLIPAQAEDFGGIVGVNMSWSPDGKTLAFYSKFDGDNEIFLIDIDGTNIRQLTYNKVPDAMPAFTPDGKGVVYSSRGKNSWDIYFIGRDGGEPELLISREDYHDLWPNMAENSRIVFTALPKSPVTEGDSDIQVWDPTTGEITPLIESDFADNQGRLSPNGNRLAFSSNRTGRLEVFLADSDGSNPRQISNSPANQERFGSAFPVFSPDESFLVFWGDDEGGFMHDHHHYVHDFETGETQVLPKRILSMAYPALSKDGTKIAYVAAVDSEPETPFYIYVMDVDGTNHRRIWPPEK